MPTIFDLVNARNIATYYEENGSNAIPYLGETLFPARKQLGLDLSWIKGFNGLPVALKPSEFDAKATLRDRIGLSKIDTEMPLFREAMRIGEKERQELLRMMDSTNSAYIMPVINRIYDDATNLVNGARVVSERMMMQLLSTGTISVADNRLTYEYDYQFPAAHKETLLTTAQWSDPNSNPVQDIQGWQDTVEDDTGVRPTRAICTRKTFNYLLENTSIRNDLDNQGRVILTDSIVKQYLLSKLNLSVSIYNKKYTTAVGGAAQQFYPDDYFTLLPPGNLGNLYYGTTPEEADLMSGATDAEVQIVNTGVAVTSIKEPHPVNVFTVVSQICLPSFEAIDTVFIAKVAGN